MLSRRKTPNRQMSKLDIVVAQAAWAEYNPNNAVMVGYILTGKFFYRESQELLISL
nr:MAG TPA: hypothetical protein [Caudoviricetes sp.]